MTLILFFTLMAFSLNLFAITAPLGIFLSALIVAVQFLDYSWSRHNYGIITILSEIKNNIMTYRNNFV